MKICVYGLYHQGPVTAACLAEAGFDVVGIDDDRAVVDGLRSGKAPLFEPGLDALIAAGEAAYRLGFTTELAPLRDADLLWIAFDTPVDDDDRADLTFVRDRIVSTFPYLADGAVILISAQLPAGSVRAIEEAFETVAGGRRVSFASAPENLRLGQALKIFRHPDRLVIGVRDEHSRAVIGAVLERFTTRLIWVSVEAAEMAKHALNAFLATSITFINEIATLCEVAGADVAEVEAALRSEPRIGENAYIRPGAAFAGGTLARDVTYLQDIAARGGAQIPLLSGILSSNQNHRLWMQRQLTARFGNLTDKTIAVLGLSYKSGTDSLRRSLSIELCRWLVSQGAVVQAFDPKVMHLPIELKPTLKLAESPAAALAGADALVLATEWQEFKALSPDTAAFMRGNLVIDQNRFLAEIFEKDHRFRYITLGAPL